MSNCKECYYKKKVRGIIFPVTTYYLECRLDGCTLQEGVTARQNCKDFLTVDEGEIANREW